MDSILPPSITRRIPHLAQLRSANVPQTLRLSSTHKFISLGTESKNISGVISMCVVITNENEKELRVSDLFSLTDVIEKPLLVTMGTLRGAFKKGVILVLIDPLVTHSKVQLTNLSNIVELGDCQSVQNCSHYACSVSIFDGTGFCWKHAVTKSQLLVRGSTRGGINLITTKNTRKNRPSSDDKDQPSQDSMKKRQQLHGDMRARRKALAWLEDRKNLNQANIQAFSATRFLGANSVVASGDLQIDFDEGEFQEGENISFNSSKTSGKSSNTNKKRKNADKNSKTVSNDVKKIKLTLETRNKIRDTPSLFVKPLS